MNYYVTADSGVVARRVMDCRDCRMMLVTRKSGVRIGWRWFAQGYGHQQK